MESRGRFTSGDDRQVLLAKREVYLGSEWLQGNFQQLGYFDVNVKKMEGGFFLIEFENKELLTSFKDKNWKLWGSLIQLDGNWQDDESYRFKQKYDAYTHGTI
ncbi:hypothetical protein GOBAR_DD31457 [Gossypium barbadense]|nr:hypothetical protein GOBAR_DD31457 [Gossypium barbadense]